MIRISKRKIRVRMAELDIGSESELSERAGLYRTTVNGALRRGSCSLATLSAIAGVLRCPLDDLLESSPGPEAV